VLALWSCRVMSVEVREHIDKGIEDNRRISSDEIASKMRNGDRYKLKTQQKTICSYRSDNQAHWKTGRC
jgi:hypothetical protein